MAKNNQNTYILEITGIFVSGLGMMLLVAISLWMVSLVISGSELVSDEVLGTTGTIVDEHDNRLAYIEGVAFSSGQVAGVVDDSSVEESEARNIAANWLTEVRELQGLTPAYRDSVLDRNAQNQARLVATNCNDNIYSDWSETIDTRIDEGYVKTFSEAIFSVDNPGSLATELPMKPIDYSRLFTGYSGYGVGVARTPQDSDCTTPFVIVFHLAHIL